MFQQTSTTSRSSHQLGIDGGRDGACVLIDPQSNVVMCFWWKCRNRKSGKVYCIESSCFSNIQECRHPYQIGAILRQCLTIKANTAIQDNRLTVISEDIYVGRNAKTSVELAKFCGCLVGQVEHLDSTGQATWVKAEKWRRELMGMNSFTKRAEAKEASKRIIPSLVTGLEQHTNKVSDHLTDATGIALWGLKHG